MSERTVIVFGAGATKACGGPLTAEILKRAFLNEYAIDREDFLGTLHDFLSSNFHDTGPDEYPPLPLLISLLDTAIDRKHAFDAEWNAERLMAVRVALDYIIFAVLDHDLQRIQTNPYRDLLEKLYPDQNADATCISLNYDIIADNSLTRFCEERGHDQNPFPNYQCDVATPGYRDRVGPATLLKLHGSLNWLYCPSCSALDVRMSPSGRAFSKALGDLYVEQEATGGSLEAGLSCHGRPCAYCGAEVQPVLISPTYFKDYRNPHISRIWYSADQTLRKAERCIIVGYSLPDDDLDVLYLLKRGLAHLVPSKIDVIEHDPGGPGPLENPVGKRYRMLFGDIEWHQDGFQEFVDRL